MDAGRTKAIQMAMELRGARGEGFATMTADGRVLDSWFLQLRLVVEAGQGGNGTADEGRDQEIVG